MPRNDQVTRQWLLMQKLEQSHGATLQELAASLFPTFRKIAVSLFHIRVGV